MQLFPLACVMSSSEGWRIDCAQLKRCYDFSHLWVRNCCNVTVAQDMLPNTQEVFPPFYTIFCLHTDFNIKVESLGRTKRYRWRLLGTFLDRNYFFFSGRSCIIRHGWLYDRESVPNVTFKELTRPNWNCRPRSPLMFFFLSSRICW